MQSYFEKEEQRQIKLLKDGTINDPGRGNGYAHFLKNDIWLNFYDEIVDDVIEYFYDLKDNNLTPKPDVKLSEQVLEGNLKSSQACCFNHLFTLRKPENKKLANQVLKKIDASIKESVFIDTGFVEFEVMEGKKKKNPLGEKPNEQHGRIRGAFSTSIDALMIGRRNKKNVLILIEWKYTEGPKDYSKGEINNSNRDVYNSWLKKDDCPIMINKKNGEFVGEDYKNLYYEPFYQLMRQTLLGWQMAEKLNEYDCKEYIHLHIIPNKNTDLLSINTSPGLNGNNICDKWKNVLNKEHKECYKILSPDDVFGIYEKYNKSLWEYLRKRYW